jgi:two-component system sensor histidine kinase KdpD
MTSADKRTFAGISLRDWAAWLVVLALVTFALVQLRRYLNEAHVALAYLVVIIAAGARRGRPLGLALAGLAFLCFDWFLLPPYGTFNIARSVDWLVLIAFLVTSIIVTQLFERARGEADAARAARLREAMFASVSHDLRTPLTTIKALAHDLAAAGDDRAETIEEEADRLTILVDDLLDLSRLNSGAEVLALEENEAEDLLGAALQQVAGSAKGRSINVKLDEGEPLLFGRFDFSQTLRVLVNLIENALKYSPDDTAVDLSVKREGPWLTFSVADRGSGVAPGDRERIFEPFYRPRGVAADVKGAGLGLSIARALADAQGGSLRYEHREGGGSVFVLRVPAVDVKEAAAM